MRVLSTSTLLLALASFAGIAQAVPTFSGGGFVDETLYQGNGLTAVQFDFAGRMWVTEKRGRILVFTPNTNPVTTYNYEYYEKPAAAPHWTAIPDFSTLTPVRTGAVNSFSLEPRLVDADFAFRFTGPITIPTAGVYTFYLNSDAGSRLYIDGSLVVNNDGVHGAVEVSGSLTLTPGEHDIRVEYFEATGTGSLAVQYSGPGIARTNVASLPFVGPTVFYDIAAATTIVSTGEGGLTGFALDPDFEHNHFLYVLYTSSTDQRVVRYTSNSTYIGRTTGVNKNLLTGLPSATTTHKGGSIGFLPTDPVNLYVSVGDDGDPVKAANVDLYNGKILKINANDGTGLTTNPYYTTSTTAIRSRVWAHKFANPAHFAFDPTAPTGEVLYVSENGDVSTDRLARIEKAADGGWNDQFTTSSGDGKRIVLQTSVPTKAGIAIVRSGAFSSAGNPVLYGAKNGTNEIRRWALTGTNFDTLTPLVQDGGGAFYSSVNHGFSSFAFGPDGSLYYTDTGADASNSSATWRIGRIRSIGTPPVANFTPTPTSGQAPLEVTFTDTSSATGGTLTDWNWDFGDGANSNAQNPVHTYEQPGIYTATLTVTNDTGISAAKQATISASILTNLSLTGQIRDGRSLPASNLTAATELRFYQKDGVTPQPFTGGTGAAGNVLAIPAGGVIDATIELPLTGDAIVISAGESSTDGVEPAYVGVPLSTIAESQSADVAFYLSDTMLRGRVKDTLGNPAPVDIGVSRASPGTYFGFAGGRDFLPGSGNTASGVNHRVVPDALGYYHVPIRTGNGGVAFYLDTSADTLSSSHGKVNASVIVLSSTTTVKNLTIGLYNGGTGEADLSGIAVTPGINFTNQIQTIFTASCVSCHTGASSGNGNLDLSSGNSLAALLGRESTGAPGVKLVDPGAPSRSYLLEKINAATPQTGTRMPPAAALTQAQQALIRDWITQSATSNPGIISLTSTTYSVQETSGIVNASISVQRTGGTSGAVGITVATVAGTSAIAGADYTAKTSTLTWNDGEGGSKIFTVPVLTDTIAEGSETLSIQLSAITGGATLGAPSTATLTILDRPYDAWRAQKFGTQANTAASLPAADYDNDGKPNALEFAVNTNPIVSQSLTGQSLDPQGGDKAKFTFTRPVLATGLTLRIKASSTLASGSWTTIATKVGDASWTSSAGVVVNDNPATGAVTVTDSESITSQPRRFMKLEVELAGYTYANLRVANAEEKVQSRKRGVAMNSMSAADFRALAPGVSWYYNWASSPGGNIPPSDVKMTYIPMLWDEGSSTTALNNYLASANPKPPVVFAINEPNLKGQAFITPQQTANTFKSAQTVANTYGIPVVGPHMAAGSATADSITADDPFHGANYVYTSAFDFLDATLYYAAQAGTTVPALGFHCYDNSGAVKYFVDQLYTKYQRPIWMTEFAYWNAANITAARDNLISATDYMERSPSVAGYAWFKERSGTVNISLLNNTGPAGVLTILGQAYVGLPPHDSDLYYRLPGRLPAENYATSVSMDVRATTDSDGVFDLTLSGTPTADYNLLVETAGSYTVKIRAVGGTGILSLYKGATLLGSASTSGTAWQTITMNITLAVGPQTLQLRRTSGSVNAVNWIEFNLP
ncbi:MAG: glycosyl hydrolase [Chthoniobacterales bacterium]